MPEQRIALYMTYLEAGGAERVMLNLALGFVSRGYAVDLLVTQARGEFKNQVPVGVNLIDLDAPRTLSAIPKLVSYLRSVRPAFLLSALSHNNLIALWSGLIAGTRVVVSEHGVVSQSTQMSPNRREKFVPLLMRLFYPFARGIVAVSTAGADDLACIAHLRRERIKVIHNPVIGSELPSLAAAGLEHKWFGEHEPPVILSVGRLAPEKGFDILIRAFALLCARRPVRLVILGEGTQRSELESLVRSLQISEDVALPGYAPNPFRFMARCKVFVLSSRSEGFGNVLVEALACGAQVVATNCPGGPAEILNNGEYGRLVPVNDPEALANAIETALDHPIPIEKLRARAEDFSIDKIATQYLEVLFPKKSVTS
jgi:glycosyltransferase involved in cell wall biosynthesis